MSEEINLGRATSGPLTEIRTVLSRAKTALAYMKEYPWWWHEFSKPVFSKSGEYIGRSPGEKVRHPDIDEMISALETFVSAVEKWDRTGRTLHRG